MMKVECRISSLYRNDIGDEVFEELTRVYPEGSNGMCFEMLLPEEDPRTQEVLAILKRHGFRQHGRFGLEPPPSFYLFKSRIYESRELEEATWLTLNPLHHRPASAERLASGLLQIGPSDLPAGVDIASPNHKGVIVSDRLRGLIEDYDFKHARFLPTERRSKSSRSGIVWELTSGLTLPRMSAHLQFFTGFGEPFIEGEHPVRCYYEGSYDYPEYRYEMSSAQNMPPFDVAVTYERFFGHECGEIVVSNRFYHFCRELNLEVKWVPIRFGDDVPHTGSRPMTWSIQDLTDTTSNEELTSVSRSAGIEPTDLTMRLAEYRSNHPDWFTEPADESAIASVVAQSELPIPVAWLNLYRISNGVEFAIEQLDGSLDGIMLFAAEELLCEHEHITVSLAGRKASLQMKLLFVGNCYSGDYLALDMTAISEDGECPVVLVSHDNSSIVVEWQSVSAFVDYCLTHEINEDPA